MPVLRKKQRELLPRGSRFKRLNYKLPSSRKQKISNNKFLAIDTETTGTCFKHGCRAYAISACDDRGTTYYWDVSVCPKSRTVKWDKRTLESVFKVLRRFKVFYFFNATFDLKALFYIDPEFESIFENAECHDTMIMAHIHDSKGPRNLKDLALLHADIDDTDEDLLDKCVKKIRLKGPVKKTWRIARRGHPHFPGATKNFHKMDMWICKAYANSEHFEGSKKEKKLYQTVCETYAVKDAERTAYLAILYAEFFNSEDDIRSAYWRQIEVLPSLFEMEEHGLHLLQERFEREMEEYQVQRDAFERSMRRMVKDDDFNPDSSIDLNYWLYEHYKFNTENLKPSEHGFSTDKDSLGILSNQINTFQALRFVDTLLKYRATNSALKYLRSYERFNLKSYLYPNIHPCGTSTVRLSSSEPNGQNVSKGKETEDIDEYGNKIIAYSLRRVFGPPKDKKWIAIDYDQLQLRIFAYLSGEKSLIQAFKDGFDFHTTVASGLFKTDSPTKAERKVAKYVNFGIIFGAGAKRIAEISGDATAYERFHTLYPNASDYLSKTIQLVRKQGYIQTPSGYTLTVPKRKAYSGVNYEVQGAEGDIVKHAISQIDLYRKNNNLLNKISFVLQVHDEIIFEVPENYEFPYKDICKIMEDASLEFGIETKVKPELIEDNWSEAVDVELAH